MNKIDSLLVERFFEENKDFLNNAKVQKIQQPTRREVILHLRKNTEAGGESRKLYININPEFYHIAFMSKENELKRNIQQPKQPPMFCMLLRKHMEGAKIINVQKPENERLIELYFENYNEVGDRIEECLSIELMGKHSNVVLYNTDNNIIIGCAHNIGAEKSKERELAGGLPFIYPPKQNKKNLLKTRSSSFFKLLTESEDSIKKTISDRFFGFSQILVEELALKLGINADLSSEKLKTEQMQVFFIALFEFLSQENLVYTLSDDFEKFSCLTQYPRKYSKINDLIDDYYAFHMQKSLLASMKSNLKNIIQKELKKQNNNLKIQQRLLDNLDKAQMNKLKADLIMSNLYVLKPGMKKTVLRDFEDKNNIEIELNENISLIDNANKYYTKYNKAKRAYTMALDFIQKTNEEIKYREELLFAIEVSSSLSDLKDISDEIMPEKSQHTKKEKEKTLNIEKREIDGFVVYIGKNNKQNDYLFSKISAPEDTWLHVLNITGSHILIKNPSGTKISDNALLGAAQLAKEFSTAKNSGKTPVIYTLRKYVKKPPNQKGGMVTYRNETEIVV